mgnify:CR=1 FL=1
MNIIKLSDTYYVTRKNQNIGLSGDVVITDNAITAFSGILRKLDDTPIGEYAYSMPEHIVTITNCEIEFIDSSYLIVSESLNLIKATLGITF